jgi:hypothetical protein
VFAKVVALKTKSSKVNDCGVKSIYQNIDCTSLNQANITGL